MVSTDLGLLAVLGALPPISPESEEGAFTRFLRAFESDDGPSSEDIDAVWEALRHVVVRWLREKIASKPRYLGIIGAQEWRTGSRSRDDPIEELLQDCFTFAFIERLEWLRNRLAEKRTIDRAIVVMLRNYLHERRMHNDRLGYLVFESLRAAVRQAVDRGELQVVKGDSKIFNSTLLASAPTADAGKVIEAEELRPVVEAWCQDLLPDLVTAYGRRRPKVVSQLRRSLVGYLKAESRHAVLFKDLVDEFKRKIRAWAVIEAIDWEFEWTRKQDEWMKRQDLPKLADCVADLIEELESRRVRRYLRDLWGFLLVWAADEISDEISEIPPSNREISRRLPIPRKRIEGLKASLKEMIWRCQAALSGKPYEAALGTENTS